MEIDDLAPFPVRGHVVALVSAVVLFHLAAVADPVRDTGPGALRVFEPYHFDPPAPSCSYCQV